MHPKTAQALARHSDINLTMSRYTHSVLEGQSEAVNRLPDLNGEADVRAAATGTDGNASKSEESAPDQSVFATCLATIRETYPRLASVVEAWDDLPEPIRAAILAMIRSTTGGDQ